jgi:hypothetical protein
MLQHAKAQRWHDTAVATNADFLPDRLLEVTAQYNAAREQFERLYRTEPPDIALLRRTRRLLAALEEQRLILMHALAP